MITGYAAQLHAMSTVASAPLHHCGPTLDRRYIIVVGVVVAHGNDIGLFVNRPIVQSETTRCVGVGDYLRACL